MAPQIIQFPGGAPSAPLPATPPYRRSALPRCRWDQGRVGRSAGEAYAPMASTAAAATVGITRRRHNPDRRAGRQSRINVIGRDAFRPGRWRMPQAWIPSVRLGPRPARRSGPWKRPQRQPCVNLPSGETCMMSGPEASQHQMTAPIPRQEECLSLMIRKPHCRLCGNYSKARQTVAVS